MRTTDYLAESEAAVSATATPDAGVGSADFFSIDESDPLLPTAEEDEPEDAEYHLDWDHQPWHKRPSVFWLLGPFCLFSLAFGAVAVPRLNIILDLICRKHFIEAGIPQLPIVGGDDNGQCQIPEVHAMASKFMLMLSLVAGLFSAFTSPRLGGLSDRYGRKGLIAISSLGLFTAEISTIAVVKVPSLDPNWLFVGAVLDGICGSFMLGMALAYSYAADCTSPRRRAVAFGAFQGCLFLGVAIGPVLGGLIVEAAGNVLVAFYAALAAHCAFILYVLLILPESLSMRRQQLARDKHSNHKKDSRESWWLSHGHPKNFLRPLTILFPTGPGSSSRLRWNLVFLAAIDFVIFGVGMGGMTVIIMYAERQFHWKTMDSSIYLSVVNTTRVTMLFLILPSLVTIFRRSSPPSSKLSGSDRLDINIIRFAIVIEAIGYTGYALAPTGVIFTLCGALTALGGIGSPTVQSSLTKHIPKEKTGQLLGAIALLHSLARVITPTVFNLLYAKTVATVPQTVFVGLGATFSVAFVCSLMVKTGVVWEDTEVIPEER